MDIIALTCRTVSLDHILQLDWPWIAEWAYAGIFAVAVQFKNKDQFWISNQKISGRVSSKSQNMSSYDRKGFFCNIRKILVFSDNSDIIANLCLTSV